MADPDFTDTGRAALLWVLWHHQGGSSPVGQAVRFALGMGQFDRLNEQQLSQAKSWAPGIPGLAHMRADALPVVVAVNPALDQGPCTVCGTPYERHGSYPTCASHPYTADEKCQHVGTLVGSVFTGAPCAGAECKNGCVRALGVPAPAATRWCPECRSAGVVGIEQDICPTCDGDGKLAADGVKGAGQC